MFDERLNDAICLDEEEVDSLNVPNNIQIENEVTAMPVISSIKEWVQSLWAQDV